MKREIYWQIKYPCWRRLGGGCSSIQNFYVVEVNGVWKLRDGRAAGDVFTKDDATSLVKHLANKWNGLHGLTMVMV